MKTKISIQLMAGILAWNAVQAAAMPTGLVVGAGFEDPIGFHDPSPVFSWRLPAGGRIQSQSAFRIAAATRAELLPNEADLWDSGKVESNQSVWVPYGGEKLSSRQKVYWQVKIWDQAGVESDWSARETFELGLLQNADWEGSWIRKSHSKTKKPSEEPKIVVAKAVYGVPGDAARRIDLTDKVRKRVQSGEYAVPANNRFAGGDPADGVKKTLMLEYTLNGERHVESIEENRKYSLLTGDINKAGNQFVPQYLRREFDLAGSVAQARLHVTAKGVYQIYINGRKVGEDYMVPGWTPYGDRIETLTYDVASQLNRGANTIGAIIGEGWYAGQLMRKDFFYPEAKPALLLQLEIIRSDGTVERIATDESWTATDNGPIRFSSIYDGEIYDARKEMPGWNEIGFDDSDWAGVEEEDLDPAVQLAPKRHYPVRIVKELETVEITEPEPGRYVFDLGQNMVGWPRLKIPVENGKTVTVRVAEMLKKDGTLYTANYRAAKSVDFYTPAETGTINWHPLFTFHGFRYVELSGLPEGVRPAPDWVTGAALHSDFPEVGSFSSSHTKLNQLQSNIRWGQRGNFLDIPTDCPQRDERLGWTGDAQVFCATSLFNFEVHSFWMSWLQSMRAEQKKDGQIHHVIPSTLDGSGSPGWADAAVTVPWNVYVRTGDRRVLEENYEMMRKWVGFYERKAQNFIVDQHGFGDWLQPYARNNRSDTPRNLIATAYFGYCSDLMRKTAEVLGRKEDAARYAEQFANIRSAFSEEFFGSEGELTTSPPTQTGYLMALDFDLLEPGLRAGAVRNLLTLIEKADGHLRTGFLGTPLIAFVLDQTGHADVAYEILFKETYPSWFFSINQGATTMWERWNSYSHKDGFGNPGMNSFNHYAYGAIGQWMYERIAGLAPDPTNPGYKHFFIQPRPGGPLTFAKAERETRYGKAASGWEQTDDGWIVNATVPPNTTATLVVPEQAGENPKVTQAGKRCGIEKRDGKLVHAVGPGTHTFHIVKSHLSN